MFLFIQMASFDNHLTPYDVRILLNCRYTIFNKSSYERFIQEEFIMTTQEGKTALITGSYGGLGTQFMLHTGVTNPSWSQC